MPAPPPKSCRIVLFGAPSITTAAGSIPTSKPVVFAAALYLGVNRGALMQRSHLAAVLWPDADDATRSDRMRWLVAQLKRSGVPVQARSPEIGFAPGDVVLDVDGLATAGSAEQVLAVVRGDVLAGFEPALSDAMVRWLEETRDEVRSGAVQALEHWLAVARRAEDWVKTEALARRILSLTARQGSASTVLAEAQGRGAPARSVGAGTTVRSALVGRGDALAHLLGGLESSGPVARRFGVAGPPGIGKTRLIDEFRAVARLRGAQVATLRCDRGDMLRPLSLAVDLARALVHLRGALGASPTSIDVLRQFTGEAVIVEEPVPDTSRRAAVYAALSDVVEAVTDEGPLAVVIDDAQWAEPGSWAVVAPIFARRSRTSPRWLVALRADTLDEASRAYNAIFPPDGAEADQEREMLWLAPLGPADVEALCVARAAPREMPPAQLRVLVQRTAGLPFIAEAVVDHWLSGGDVAALPPSVTRLVDARLDRLSPAAERALAAVAVLGADATSFALEAVAALDKRELMNATHELETAGILRTVEDDRIAPHALWTEAVLRRTPRSATRLLHRYAAEWLERSTAGPDVAEPRRHWAIATHWIDAGEPARAQRELEGAATILAASGFAAEGAALLERAADIAGVSEAALQYWRRAAELHMIDGTAGAHAVQRIHVQYDAVAQALDPESWNPHHEVELLRHQAVQVLSPISSGTIRLYAGCALAPIASRTHRLHAALLLLHYYSHIPYDRPIIDAVWRAMEQLPVTSRNEEIERDLVAAQYYTRVTGQAADGLAYAVRARDAILQQDPRSNRRYFDLMNLIADCHEFLGDLDAAQATRREMLQRGQEWKRKSLARMALTGLIGTALEAGRTAEARAYLPLFQPALFADTPDAIMGLAIYRAVCALEEGDTGRARAEFPVPLDTAETVDALTRARTLAIYAHVALLEGDDNVVRTLLPRLLDCFSIPTIFMDHPAYVTAMCLARCEGADAAAAFVRRFLETFRVERWTPRAELLRFAGDVPIPT